MVSLETQVHGLMHVKTWRLSSSSSAPVHFRGSVSQHFMLARPFRMLEEDMVMHWTRHPIRTAISHI